MFLAAPGFVQPFGFVPYPAPAAHDLDSFGSIDQYGFYPAIRQPPSRRRQGRTHPTIHPHSAVGFYPWPTARIVTPDVILHQHDINTDDSASEDDDFYSNYPQDAPQTPRSKQQPHASRASSSTTCHSNSAHPAYAHTCRPTSTAKGDHERVGPWAGGKQPSPLTARSSHMQQQQVPSQATFRNWCPDHAARLQQLQQSNQQTANALAKQQACAAQHFSAKATPEGSQGVRHIPVHTSNPSSAQQSYSRQGHHHASACAATAAAPSSRRLTMHQAATIIQSWWRMRRVAQQRPALEALMAAAAQLRLVAAKFQACRKDSSTHSSTPAATMCSGLAASADRAVPCFLTHKQYLELQELAMRGLLELDCIPCSVPEFRAVRKRLAASAVSLLDKIQAAFSATVTASMEVPDSVVQEALGQSGQEVTPPTHQQQQQQEMCATGSASDAASQDTEALPVQQPLVRVVLRVNKACCEAATQTE